MVQRVQSADVIGDLVKSLASNGASCLVLVAEKWASSDLLNDDTNPIPLTFIESSINASRIRGVVPHMQGIHPVRDCSHYLLWFKNANRILSFLDRYDTSTTLIWNEALSNYFRYTNELGMSQDVSNPGMSRKGKFFAHVLSELVGQDDARVLFGNPFYKKVSNAVVAVKDQLNEGNFNMWTKSPCQSVPPKLTNVWSMSNGLRLVVMVYKIIICIIFSSYTFMLIAF